MRHKRKIKNVLLVLTTSYITVRQITYITPLHLDIITISTYNHPSKWMMVINIEKIMANRDQQVIFNESCFPE